MTGRAAGRLALSLAAGVAAWLTPAFLRAHVGPNGEPVPDGLYATLFIEPELLVVLALATATMLWTFGPFRRRSAPSAPGRAARSGSGFLA